MNFETETEAETRVTSGEQPVRSGPVPPGGSPGHPGRGRPSLMSAAVVLEKISQLAIRREGLFRVHHTHPGLYARARRQFGSWAAAVRAAGVDYDTALGAARRRSIQARRRRRRVAGAPGL